MFVSEAGASKYICVLTYLIVTDIFTTPLNTACAYTDDKTDA